MDKMIKKTASDQRLPPNLPKEDFEQPDKPGYILMSTIK
jgi:DNA polymerase-3 subunit epsilon